MALCSGGGSGSVWWCEKGMRCEGSGVSEVRYQWGPFLGPSPLLVMRTFFTVAA